MKHDVKIMGRKEKKDSTLFNYYNLNKAVLSKQEKERKREKIRVSHILTPNYYSNTKENKNE